MCLCVGGLRKGVIIGAYRFDEDALSKNSNYERFSSCLLSSVKNTRQYSGWVPQIDPQ